MPEDTPRRAIEFGPPRRSSMGPEDVEEWEALQKKKRRERDPDYQQHKREMEAAWRKPSEEEEGEIERGAEKERGAREEYSALRSDLETALASAGIEDFELYGAGDLEQKERLSPLEYQGALRAVGPRGSDEFVDIVTDMAMERGFKVEMDRPPSVTHLSGQTIRSDGERESIQGRPFLYIYRSYRTEFPTEYEREMARGARLKQSETEKLYGALNVYENRIAEIAHEITGDPHMFGETIGELVAREISRTSDFKIVREEVKDAADHAINIQRTIHMPVQIGDHKAMVYFLAEAKEGNILIDLLGCFPGMLEEAITKLSEMIVR